MKKRRILSVWLLAALLLASTVTAAWAASDPGTLVFDVSEGPVTITGGATVQVSYGAGQLKSDIAPDALITLIGTTTANAVTVNAGTAGSPINIALSGVTGQQERKDGFERLGCLLVVPAVLQRGHVLLDVVLHEIEQGR